mgnify:CR=1 FL=1
MANLIAAKLVLVSDPILEYIDSSFASQVVDAFDVLVREEYPGDSFVTEAITGVGIPAIRLTQCLNEDRRYTGYHKVFKGSNSPKNLRAFIIEGDNLREKAVFGSRSLDLRDPSDAEVYSEYKKVYQNSDEWEKKLKDFIKHNNKIRPFVGRNK